MQDVNRLKLVLVEQKKTSKWLSADSVSDAFEGDPEAYLNID